MAELTDTELPRLHSTPEAVPSWAHPPSSPAPWSVFGLLFVSFPMLPSLALPPKTPRSVCSAQIFALKLKSHQFNCLPGVSRGVGHRYPALHISTGGSLVPELSLTAHSSQSVHLMSQSQPLLPSYSFCCRFLGSSRCPRMTPPPLMTFPVPSSRVPTPALCHPAQTLARVGSGVRSITHTHKWPGRSEYTCQASPLPTTQPKLPAGPHKVPTVGPLPRLILHRLPHATHLPVPGPLSCRPSSHWTSFHHHPLPWALGKSYSLFNS